VRFDTCQIQMICQRHDLTAFADDGWLDGRGLAAVLLPLPFRRKAFAGIVRKGKAMGWSTGTWIALGIASLLPAACVTTIMIVRRSHRLAMT
jgi:hypothetical protein